MRIGLIGAGKVGFSLGKFFVLGGLPVTGYWSRHRESAQEAADFTGTKCYDSLQTLVEDCDALFLTVTDAAIPEVFRSLTEFDLSGKQICHCSGAMTAGEAFPGLEKTGAFGYSVHPLFPVSSKYDAYGELAGAFFCLEGDGPHLEEWRQRISSLGCRARIIPGEAKVRYHAACAFASNLTIALVQESLELLETCGFDERESLDALAPLMRSNLEHILRDGPREALTGPAERGDTDTVAKHLECLATQDERALYCSATEKLAELAVRKHPERDYQPLLQLLNEEM